MVGINYKIYVDLVLKDFRMKYYWEERFRCFVEFSFSRFYGFSCLCEFWVRLVEEIFSEVIEL